jgi:hypothetical protein
LKQVNVQVQSGKAIPVDGVCTASTSENCLDYPSYLCKDINGSTGFGVCKHKGPFPPRPMEYVGLIAFSIIMALCNIAGIGGGGIANPML